MVQCESRLDGAAKCNTAERQAKGTNCPGDSGGDEAATTDVSPVAARVVGLVGQLVQLGAAVRQYRAKGVTKVNPDNGRLGNHAAVGVAENAAVQLAKLGGLIGLSQLADVLGSPRLYRAFGQVFISKPRPTK
jgi:hypothetical protein